MSVSFASFYRGDWGSKITGCLLNVLAKLLQVCPTLCDPMNYSPDCSSVQAPLSMGFPRQEYRSALPCLSPGDQPNPGMEPLSLASTALAGRFFFTTAPPGKPQSQKWAVRESHVSQAWTFLGAEAGVLKLYGRYNVLAKMLTTLSLGPVIVPLHSKKGVFTNVIKVRDHKVGRLSWIRDQYKHIDSLKQWTFSH